MPENFDKYCDHCFEGGAVYCKLDIKQFGDIKSNSLSSQQKHCQNCQKLNINKSIKKNKLNILLLPLQTERVIQDGLSSKILNILFRQKKLNVLELNKYLL